MLWRPATNLGETLIVSFAVGCAEGFRLLKCGNCGSLVREGIERCGMCGSDRFSRAEQFPQSRTAGPVPVRRHGRARVLLALTIGAGVLVEGSILVLLPVDPSLTAFGFFTMAFGALILLAVTGAFGGTPYRSRVLNRTDQWLKRRERKKYSD